MARRSAISILLLAFAAEAAAEGDPEKGRSLSNEWSCSRCHGPDGNARSTSFQPVPMLAGQPASYLVKEMRAYASGDRLDTSRNGRMAELLRELSEQDLEDIAAFYEMQKRY